jgi:hypothetical protein
MLKKLKKSPMNIVLLSATFLCMLIFSLTSIKFSSVLYVIICGVVGLVAYGIGYFKDKKGNGGDLR